ncbi:CvfB family protein [Balneatrix alpica]|uniref:S1 RNA-binding domain-containing protein n=1 Tax=Balneatrix alpica TaxID=75684 RepID=A0ABV5Z6Q8_9GAMM|nr:S1-like domain-containing RNA-binding protein [Balneatrix alpica]
MIKLGRLNRLKVVREVPFGVYLDDGDSDGILLPKREVPEGCRLGDQLQVFVYLDSKDIPIASTRKPRVMVGEFASLKVTDVNRVGAFLDWGMPKELFLPYSEQLKPLKVGDWCTVYIYIDNSKRIAASAKTDRFIEPAPTDLAIGQAVELLILRRTDLGYPVIIDNRYEGLLHHQDLFREVRPGMRLSGFIKQCLADGKVDVMLDKPGYARVDPLAQKILDYLEAHDGFCPLGDKSDPNAISDTFGVSKKAYKMALGALMKAGRIRQDEQGVHLKSTSNW